MEKNRLVVTSVSWPEWLERKVNKFIKTHPEYSSRSHLIQVAVLRLLESYEKEQELLSELFEKVEQIEQKLEEVRK